jgi:glycosyltransferase involved in cell wall biosynthesis
MTKVAIYSPEACGNIGHGFLYASRLLEALSRDHTIVFFTLKKEGCSDQFRQYGLEIIESTRFGPAIFHKNRYLKFGPFSGLAFGLSRIYYHYRLLAQFYRLNPSVSIYHLFEFEYISAYIFMRFRSRICRRTVFGFHSSDFKWIKGRPFTINLYKSVLGQLLRYIVVNSFAVTVHGEVLRKELIGTLSVRTGFEKIFWIPYGCSNFEERDKIDSRKKLELKHDGYYVLFFGVLREDKGILEVLRNVDRLNAEINLIVAGSEVDIKIQDIRNLMAGARSGNRIIADIRYLPEEDVRLYYSASDLVIVPHKSYHIAFSGPLSLAVENHRPVLASDKGEIGNFVRKYGIGETFRSEDWDDFIRLMNGMYEKYRKGRFGYGFEKCIQENSWESMAQRISGIYAALPGNEREEL